MVAAVLLTTATSADNTIDLKQVGLSDSVEVPAGETAYYLDGDWTGSYSEVAPLSFYRSSADAAWHDWGANPEVNCAYGFTIRRQTFTYPYSRYYWAGSGICAAPSGLPVIHSCTANLSYWRNGQWNGAGQGNWDADDDLCVSGDQSHARPAEGWLEVDRGTYKLTFCHSAYTMWPNGQPATWLMGWHCHHTFGWVPACAGNQISPCTPQ